MHTFLVCILVWLAKTAILQQQASVEKSKEMKSLKLLKKLNVGNKIGVFDVSTLG